MLLATGTRQHMGTSPLSSFYFSHGTVLRLSFILTGLYISSCHPPPSCCPAISGLRGSLGWAVRDTTLDRMLLHRSGSSPRGSAFLLILLTPTARPRYPLLVEPPCLLAQVLQVSGMPNLVPCCKLQELILNTAAHDIPINAIYAVCAHAAVSFLVTCALCDFF
jgi:hypothetical protein